MTEKPERTTSRTATHAPVAPPLRVAVIGPRGLDSIIGGIERHCATIYPPLAADCPDLRFRLFVRRTFEPSQPHAQPRLAIVAVPAPTHGAVETLVYSLVALLCAVRRVDIVHFHGIGPAFFTPVARLFGLKVLVSHHAADFARPKWSWPAKTFLRAGERIAGLFAHRVVCVSEALRQDFLDRVPSAADRTVTIAHGATLTSQGRPGTDAALVARLGLAPGGYILGVGRLEETKGFADLIRAHGLAGPDALPLVIVGGSVGDSMHETMLHAMAGPDVLFLGMRYGAELGALYRQSAAFFHASAMEGFGLVVLEALMSGAPVCASDIAVHREFGMPDDAYFPVGDTAAIAARMRRVAVRTAPWPPAAAISARYSVAAEVQGYADLYRALRPAGAPPARQASNTAQ